MIIKEFKQNSHFVKSDFHNVNKIIDRAKDAFGIVHDADFARTIGILPSTLTNWRKRGTINYPLLVSRCQDINLDWLLTGYGDRIRSAGKLPESTPENTDISRISFLEKQIRELYSLFHEKHEQSPRTDSMVEIPLFMHPGPDGTAEYSAGIGRFIVISKEWIRDKNTAFAIRLHDNTMIGEGFLQNDLLIVDTSLPVKDNCFAVVTYREVQSLKKLFLREEKLYITNGENHEMTPVSIGRNIEVLGIVRKVVRELY